MVYIVIYCRRRQYIAVHGDILLFMAIDNRSVNATLLLLRWLSDAYTLN